MFVVSYCQIYSFHPSFNLDKIFIFRSFQQSPEEIYDLSHFRQENIPLLDKVTFSQWRDAATSVLALEKSTSLSELFLTELKFTIDTLNDWFSKLIKPKFLELNDIKKQALIKESPLIPFENTCCICGFLLDTEACRENKRWYGWYGFIVEREELFIRNIYVENELKEMENLKDINSSYYKLERFIDLVSVREQTLECPQWIKKKKKSLSNSWKTTFIVSTLI